MSRFKIGQRVVAVKDHSQGEFKKGDEFIVDGFSCCENCGKQRINLLGFDSPTTIRCKNGCDHIGSYKRIEFSKYLFAPLQSFGDHIAETIIQELTPFIELSEEIEKR